MELSFEKTNKNHIQSERTNNLYLRELKLLEKKLEELNKDFLDNNLVFRFLELEDIDKFYFDLLSELTVSPLPSFEDWIKQFEKLNNSNNFIIVIEDKQNSKIIGNITCIIEEKFIRNLSRVAHIEDVVILKEYRNRKLGSKLISLVIEFSKEANCYKVILDGRKEAIDFYKKFGFEKKFNCMGFYP